jgi:hypothetical protein
MDIRPSWSPPGSATPATWETRFVAAFIGEDQGWAGWSLSPPQGGKTDTEALIRSGTPPVRT